MTWKPDVATGGRTVQFPEQVALADAQQTVIDVHEAIGDATAQAGLEAATAALDPDTEGLTVATGPAMAISSCRSSRPCGAPAPSAVMVLVLVVCASCWSPG
jgi:hypothetical protein